MKDDDLGSCPRWVSAVTRSPVDIPYTRGLRTTLWYPQREVFFLHLFPPTADRIDSHRGYYNYCKCSSGSYEGHLRRRQHTSCHGDGKRHRHTRPRWWLMWTRTGRGSSWKSSRQLHLCRPVQGQGYCHAYHGGRGRIRPRHRARQPQWWLVWT